MKKMNTIVLFKLTFLIISLSGISDAGAAGKYQINHKGAYVAHMRVNFEINGVWQTYESDDWTSGFSRVLEIPKGSKKNSLIVKNAVFIATWYTIFQLDWEEPQSLCFNIGGTTFHPSWNYWVC